MFMVPLSLMLMLVMVGFTLTPGMRSQQCQDDCCAVHVENEARGVGIVPSSAAMASVFGFNVPTSMFSVGNWMTARSSSFRNGEVIGETTVQIARARAHEPASGQHLTSFLVSVTMSPRRVTYRSGLFGISSTTSFGHFEYVRLRATIPQGATLIAHEPMNRNTGTSYSLGVSLGSSFGISASMSFYSDALTIANRSRTPDRNVDIAMNFNPTALRGSNLGRWRWAMEETRHIFMFTVRHPHEFTQNIRIDVNYRATSSSPSFFMDRRTGHSPATFNLPAWSR